MKVSELTGAELDAAVALADGWSGATAENHPFAYSTRWDYAGDIIERERISIAPGAPDTGNWIAFKQVPGVDGGRHWIGPGPLIAAMRAYVASKFGDEVPS